MRPASRRVEITSVARAGGRRGRPCRSPSSRSGRAGSSMTSRGAPASSTSPCARIAMRLHRSLTSSTMWVERITTTFSPISESRLRKRLRSSGSRPAVGSSTMISFGSPSSAWAMPKRCRMPPEKVPSLRFRDVAEVGLVQQGASTTARRSRPSTMPLSRAKWSSRSRPRSWGRRRTPAADSRGPAHLVLLAQHVDAVELDARRRRPPAGWRGCASASTCRRRSGRAGRTCRAGY